MYGGELCLLLQTKAVTTAALAMELHYQQWKISREESVIKKKKWSKTWKGLPGKEWKNSKGLSVVQKDFAIPSK